MVRKKEVKLESADKKLEYLKKLLFSFILLLIFSIVYMVVADMFISSMNEKIEYFELKTFEMQSTSININGVKSPNLNMELVVSEPVNLILDINGPDFYKRIKTAGYDSKYSYNLILPEDLVGKELTVTVKMYDRLAREKTYEKSYNVPALLAPKVRIS